MTQQSIRQIFHRPRFRLAAFLALAGAGILALQFFFLAHGDSSVRLSAAEQIVHALITVVTLLSLAGLALLVHRPETQFGSPSETFRRASSYSVLGSLGILLIIGCLSVWDIGGQSAAGLGTSLLVTLLGVPMLLLSLRQLYWLDRLAQLRPHKYSRRVRAIIFGGAGLVMFVEVLRSANMPSVGTLSAFLVAVIAIATLFSGWRRAWLNSLSKSEKYKGFAVSFLGSVLSVCILVLLNSAGSDVGTVLRRVLPGADVLTMLIFVLVCLNYARISIVLLLSLPTAGVMDRRLREVRALATLSRNITHVNDSGELMRSVAIMVRDVCGAQAVWIERIDQKKEISYALGIKRNALKRLYKGGHLQSLLDAEKYCLHADDLDKLPQLQDLRLDSSRNIRSLMVAPLMQDRKIVGALFAGHADEFVFEHEDVALLTAFADTVSIALENAWLFEKSMKSERYKSQMRVAHDVQRKLLPESVPRVEGLDIAAYSSPAYEVGGDYYDFVRLADDRLCAVVADVSGKGISAAFYMAEIKGIVLALAPECNSPGELVCKVNKAVHGSMEKRSFITMIAVAWDPHAAELSLVRAGHTPLLIHQGGRTRTCTPKGLGVGLVGPGIFDSALQEMTLDVHPGDKVLLFTDGVNEVHNEDKGELGLERLKDILTEHDNFKAESLLGRIVRLVAEFGGEVLQHDDVTVVTMIFGEGVGQEANRDRKQAEAVVN